MDIIEEAKLVFDIEIAELKKIRDRMDNGIERAATLIMESKGKVVITGIGKSGLVGKKIASTFASTGTLSIFMNSAEGLHGDLGMISKNDVVIAISNSGNSDEVVGIIPAIKKIGAKIIAMTGNKNSKLGIESDVILDIGVETEACPLNLAPTSSTTATIVMGDALAAVLIKLRNFQPENFALYHPGGSLGRRLLLKVRDVMHSGDKLPLGKSEEGIESILLKLSEKRMGAVCIADDQGNLQGIITEGDIRRALKEKDKFFSFKASDIMSVNPSKIDEESMAIDALELMENRESQISVLPVVMGNKLTGIIRIHDLIGRVR
jgi:arabinose-5-phosphate isomerase